MDYLEIKASKLSAAMLIILSAVFVVAGFFFIIDANIFSNNADIEQAIMGVVSVVMFSGGIFIGDKKFKQKEAQLILSDKGLFYDPKDSEYGFVAWSEITEFKEEKIKFDKFLFIHLEDPQKIIDNEKGRAKRNLMKLNLKTHGSPISVSDIGLDIDYNTLKSEMNRFHKKFSQSEVVLK